VGAQQEGGARVTEERPISFEQFMADERRRLVAEQVAVIMGALDGVPHESVELAIRYTITPTVVPDVGLVSEITVRRLTDANSENPDSPWEEAKGYSQALKADGTPDGRTRPYWRTLPTEIVAPLIARLGRH
jgi:hypothetical protein